jgi:hypothetical protein
MVDARLGELLALERRFVFRIFPQITVRTSLLNFLWEDEIDLVIQPLNFGLQFILEFVEHSGKRRT